MSGENRERPLIRFLDAIGMLVTLLAAVTPLGLVVAWRIANQDVEVGFWEGFLGLYTIVIVGGGAFCFWVVGSIFDNIITGLHRGESKLCTCKHAQCHHFKTKCVGDQRDSECSCTNFVFVLDARKGK